MTGAATLVARTLLALLAGPGECADDATVLVAEAETLVSPPLDRASIDRARRLYRRARILAPLPELSLRAADLACAAGDEEECGDLLSEVAEASPRLLAASDRLLLARRAESRRAWREAIGHYQAFRERADAGAASWAADRIRRIEIEVEAEAMTLPVAAPPPPEARLALADARRAIATGDLAKARERLATARRLAAGFVEADLALAALEIRQGRAPEAARAYRDALSSDPARFEALVGLANVLWDEPDRAAKEEALSLTERAIAARPDATELLKVAALRWADWGDATKALARLDAYRRRAGPDGKRQTESLRETLARRVDALLTGEGTAGEPDLPELSSLAVGEWRLAQAYVRRGDPSSLASALEHLREAERLDPTFARAPELAGEVYERLGEASLAEAAYERAVAADPTRAAVYEKLALLLAGQPAKSAAAEEVWRRAEQAGSSEALFHLAGSSLRRGRRGEALQLFRQYLAESPGGVHTEEVSRSIALLEGRRRSMLGALAIAALAVLVAGGAMAYRRVTGRTFEEWIRAHPSRARDARPIVGRLRHEVVKHGGLLLDDAAKRLADPAVRALLESRLFGSARNRGLVVESRDAFSALEALARQDNVRLDLTRRDPLFSPIAKATSILARQETSLRPSDLKMAAELLRSSHGAEITAVLDRATVTRADLSEMKELLRRVAAETGCPSPELETLGPDAIAVRIDPDDWRTIWRNLFANALAADGSAALRLGLSAELVRDSVTQLPIARFVLFDNVESPLSAEMIRGRAADRGWGVVADLVRSHEGLVDVVEPTPGYRKGIVIELPALEHS
jgi:tetratricopeptide (TPR) repeat protein